MEKALRLAAALKGVAGAAGRQLLSTTPDDTPLPFLPVLVGPEAWVVHGSEHLAAMACRPPAPPSSWPV